MSHHVFKWHEMNWVFQFMERCGKCKGIVWGIYLYFGFMLVYVFDLQILFTICSYMPCFRSSTPVLISKPPRTASVSFSPQNKGQLKASVSVSPQLKSQWKLKTKLVSLWSYWFALHIAYFWLVFPFQFTASTLSLSLRSNALEPDGICKNIILWNNFFSLYFVGLQYSYPDTLLFCFHTHNTCIRFSYLHFKIFFSFNTLPTVLFQVSKTRSLLKVLQKCFCLYFFKK